MKKKSIIDLVRLHLIFIVLSVSFIVLFSNYYIFKSNLEKNFVLQKNKLINNIKNIYVYPLWRLDKKEIELLSISYIQNKLIAGIDVVSMPYKSHLFRYKGKQQINVETDHIPIFYEGKEIGYVTITFNKDSTSKFITNLLTTNISLVFFIIIFIYFSTNLILKNNLEGPISVLASAISKVKQGEYNYSAPSMEFVEFKPIFDSVVDLGLKIKQRERELKQSEEKFRNLAENAPLGILIYQGERFVYCNKASTEIFGYTKEEIMSKKFWEFVSLEQQDIIRQRGILRQQGRLDLPNRYEFEILAKDGKKKLLDFCVSVIDYEGKPAGLVIIQDITEEKRIQKELERLRNMLQNIINSMPSMLITVDREFNVIYWNKYVENILGDIKVKNLRNKNFFDVIDMEDELKDKLNKAILARDVQSYLRKSEDKDGSVKVENIIIFPLKSNGVDGAVIKIDDITEQVKFEEMLVHSEKMITIGNMASGIAHEINNPLAIIMQACDVCLNRLKDTSRNREMAKQMGIDFDCLKKYIQDRKIDKMLFNIKEATMRASDIIRGLLSFTHGSSGIVDNIDIREVMEMALTMAYNDYSLKKRYDVKKIKIKKEYEDVPRISCDPIKMQQVFLNIIKNSAQAMAGMEHPEITITISEVKDGMVKINIKDNGPGIPKDIIGNIFDPFYTTKQVGEGTGLGLYISYFIVTKQHKGKIFVDSAPEKGTAITIYLPISPCLENFTTYRMLPQ
ncbi:PAS domain-containing sensor histidine kinase [Desulfothermus sp.]